MPAHVFVGSAALDGWAAADGAAVTAWIDGEQVAGTKASGGDYTLLVDQGDSCFTGKTVSFKVSGANAAETATWIERGAEVLNLVATTRGPLPPKNTESLVDLYVGAVTVGGSRAPDGTEITAWLSEFSEPIGTAFTKDSEYALLAMQYGLVPFSGKTILFKVNGQEVTSATYVPGGATLLDLVVP